MALRAVEIRSTASRSRSGSPALRELIVSGQLPEGTPLVQRDLARAARRLADADPGRPVGAGARGARRGRRTGRALVSRLTREDLEEIYAARLGLEGLAARVGAVAVTDADVERMGADAARSRGSPGRRTSTATSRARWDFHAICYLASGRTRLVAEVERLFWRAERYNHLVLSSAERFQRSVAYYREFLARVRGARRSATERASASIHESDRAARSTMHAAPSLPSERGAGAERDGRDEQSARTSAARSRTCCLLDPTARVCAFTRCCRRRPTYDRAGRRGGRELAASRRAVDERRRTARPWRRTPCSSAAAPVTALVTTEGFRDVLELRRMRMPHLYDYFWTKPPSLVAAPAALRDRRARHRRGRGAEARSTRARHTQLAARLARAGAESVAVCLLHAHVYPEHERRLGEILRAELPDVPVSLSSEILREQQEYERTATTVVNAYVRPLMARYLGEPARGLDAARAAHDHAVVGRRDERRRRGRSGPSTRSSPGPPPASSRALALARALGLENVITFDMGGTTAKASLIEGGARLAQPGVRGRRGALGRAAGSCAAAAS